MRATRRGSVDDGDNKGSLSVRAGVLSAPPSYSLLLPQAQSGTARAHRPFWVSKCQRARSCVLPEPSACRKAVNVAAARQYAPFYTPALMCVSGGAFICQWVTGCTLPLNRRKRCVRASTRLDNPLTVILRYRLQTIASAA